jgi:hypothetical protein
MQYGIWMWARQSFCAHSALQVRENVDLGFCGKQTPHSEFVRAISKHGQTLKGDNKQCDACLQRREEEVAEMTRSSLAHMQKKRKQ